MPPLHNLILTKTVRRCAYLLGIFLLFPTMSFSQHVEGQSEDDDQVNRSEIKYKQRHSSLIANQENTFADGIKIKRDLSILQELQEERIFNAQGIPADDLYEGIWNTDYAHVYGSLKNIPDTFKVNLENFYMPTEGRVTSNFGMRRRRMHNGIDLKVQTGDTIYAAFDGKVRIRRFERRGYGNYLAVRHHNGLETIYGHLSKFLVEVDDVVKAGDPIALGGNTGRSTGSHLHLEFRFLGMAINPTDIVDFENFVCHRDNYTITKKSFRTPNKYTKGSVQYHRVKRGDTLSKIARRYGTSIAALRKKNNMSSNAILRIGTSLRI